MEKKTKNKKRFSCRHDDRGAWWAVSDKRERYKNVWKSPWKSIETNELSIIKDAYQINRLSLDSSWLVVDAGDRLQYPGLYALRFSQSQSHSDPAHQRTRRVNNIT